MEMVINFCSLRLVINYSNYSSDLHSQRINVQKYEWWWQNCSYSIAFQLSFFMRLFLNTVHCHLQNHLNSCSETQLIVIVNDIYKCIHLFKKKVSSFRWVCLFIISHFHHHYHSSFIAMVSIIHHLHLESYFTWCLTLHLFESPF